MPVAKVQLPDGRVAKFEVAEGTSPQEVEQFAIEKFTPSPEEAPTREVGATEAAIAGAGQGVTAGFGEEAIAGLSSPFIYGMSRLIEGLGYDTRGLADKTLREIYQEEVGRSRAELQQAEEQQPAAYLGGEIAGSMVGAGKVAKGAGRLGIKLPSLRTGTTTQRIGKSAAAAAGTSALYGAGTAEEGERLQEAGEALLAGGAIGAAIPVIAKLPQSKQAVAVAEDVKNMARKAYKKASEQGGLLKAGFVDKFIDAAEKVRPQTRAGKIIAGDDEAASLLKRMQLLRGKPIDLEESREIDQVLGDLIDRYFKDGRLQAEGKKILDIQTKFREMIENAPLKQIGSSKEGFASLREARKLWSKSRKLDDIQKIIARADQMDNPATGIKTGFRTLANNPKRLRGFSKKEQALIKKAAKSGMMTDALRVMGSRLIPIGATLSGKGFGATATAQLGTTLSREAATRTQQLKALKVIDEILKDVPIRQQQLGGRYTLPPAAIAPIAGGNNGS